MRRRASRSPTLLLAAVLAGSPASASAQELLPAALGGAAGLAAGGYVSVGIWTAKARFADEYLFSARDAIGWEATPILVGMATGAGLGFLDPDRLVRTVIGGGAGFFLGTGIGMTIGSEVWRRPEGRWAGGVIGGAAGILLGGAIGILWPARSTEEEPADAAGHRRGIPIVVSIPF